MFRLFLIALIGIPELVKHCLQRSRHQKQRRQTLPRCLHIPTPPSPPILQKALHTGVQGRTGAQHRQQAGQPSLPSPQSVSSQLGQLFPGSLAQGVLLHYLQQLRLPQPPQHTPC